MAKSKVVVPIAFDRPRVRVRTGDQAITIFSPEGIITVRLGDVSALVGELVCAGAAASNNLVFPFGEKQGTH